MQNTIMKAAPSSQSIILPLALAQFICSYAASNMLTSSVNVVQSSFPEQDQGEISGLSRSISNLGSSFGTAIVGSVLVSPVLQENKTYGLAIITVVVIALIGLIAAILLPSEQTAPQP